MGTSTFSGPVVSTAGFTGALTGAVTATTAAATTSLTVGSGTAITKIIKGTVAVDPSSLTTATGETLTITLTGAATGDAIILHPPAAGLTTGLLFSNARVSATNEVKVEVWNPTGGTINEASANCIYMLFRS